MSLQFGKGICFGRLCYGHVGSHGFVFQHGGKKSTECYWGKRMMWTERYADSPDCLRSEDAFSPSTFWMWILLLVFWGELILKFGGLHVSFSSKEFLTWRPEIIIAWKTVKVELFWFWQYEDENLRWPWQERRATQRPEEHQMRMTLENRVV